jgi:DNA-binding NarL/FixJ family response regulator
MIHRMIRGRPWTPEEDVLLRDLAAIGKNVRAIANEMNRSEAGVRKRAKETAVNIVNARRLKARPME